MNNINRNYSSVKSQQTFRTNEKSANKIFLTKTSTKILILMKNGTVIIVLIKNINKNSSF